MICFAIFEKHIFAIFYESFVGSLSQTLKNTALQMLSLKIFFIWVDERINMHLKKATRRTIKSTNTDTTKLHCSGTLKFFE